MPEGEAPAWVNAGLRWLTDMDFDGREVEAVIGKT
jgi:hypothetical protein